MHLSSLSSPYGIGSMGKPARDFIDFLKAAGQGYWQLLPICPTSYGILPTSPFLPMRAILILLIWNCLRQTDFWNGRSMER